MSIIPNLGGGGGQFWYGPYGFLYKKKAGGGARKNPPYGLICNQPQHLYNKYISGSGVGASSVATRRAKLRLATSCKKNQQCFPSYAQLGQNQLRVSPYTVNTTTF
jgi:hypothetical protein